MERQSLVDELVADVTASLMQVVVMTAAQCEEIAAGRESIYYDHGIVPPSLDVEHKVVLVGICPEKILAGTEWMDDAQLAEYFEWWSSRIKLRFIKLHEVGFLHDEKLIEDMVDVAMREYAYPQTGWWQ